MNKLMVAPVSPEAQAPKPSEASMHRRRPRTWCIAWSGWFLLGMISHFSWTAHAQSTPQPTAAAPTAYDRFIEDALQAYDAGRFAEARTSFRRAHELMPTARTLRTIGMCSFNLGDYADAAWNLEKARSDTRKPLNDEQQRHVSELIARANQRIGRFRLRVEPASATLSVDQQSALLLDNELLLESGHHEIEARAHGYQLARTTLNVEGGDRTTFVLQLVPESNAVAQGGPGAGPDISASQPARSDTQPSSSDASSVQTWIGYSTLGLGVASLIGFGVVSGLAVAEQNKLDDRCPKATCGSAYRSEVDRYDALRTASTITLIAGGTLTALGAVLLFTRSERSTESAFEPMLGPGQIGLRGRL
jgi:hypothetical protein